MILLMFIAMDFIWKQITFLAIKGNLVPDGFYPENMPKKENRMSVMMKIKRTLIT